MECLRKKQFFVTFRVWLYVKQLGWLGGYPNHWDVADMSNLFYFHFVFIWLTGMTCFPRSCLLKRTGMNKNRYKHFSQPGETVMGMRMYQLKLRKSLTYFYWVVMNMYLVCWDGTDFIKIQKYIILLTDSSPPIFFPNKHRPRE